ncbi:S24 family peptidase [Pectobacterium aroidearum]|uniref:S24 family peptidase n=1 Tax=Pectobacterium aroidearum TaxID=1201031 RepID=UPI002FCAA627
MLSGKELGRAIEQAIDKKISSGAVKSKADIARHFKIKAPSIHDWIKKGSISKDKLPELWNYFSDVVGPDHWGLNGSINSPTAAQEYKNILDNNVYRVDVLDAEASAGNGRFVSSDVDETISSIVYDTEKALKIFGHRPADTIKVITVTGDSMSGTIETGDYIFVDVAKNYFDGDGIYVFSFKGALLVKRLQFTADGILVRSDNAKYTDWVITDKTEPYLKVIGRVIYSHGISRYV